jgi:uncharacterized protein YdeI (BOF family)
MFLQNKDSFVLRRGTIVKPGFSVFSPPHQRFWYRGLPNTYSFVLVKRPIVDPVRGKTSLEEGSSADHAFQAGQTSNGTEQSKTKDQDKRNFLKVAGVAGAGLTASLLLPKKAQALIMGSSPTTGVVGVKDSANARINPATEGTLDEVLKTTDLTFETGTGSLEVKVTSQPSGSSSFSDSADVAKSGRVDDNTRHVYVDVKDSVLPTAASTETTLQTISFGGFKFTLRLATVGDIDYVGEAAIGTAIDAGGWRIKRIDSGTTIEPTNTGIIIKWAGTGTFDQNQTWDGRAGYTYS